jgi:2-hydroxychromene-2-carboxylate isomerase
MTPAIKSVDTLRLALKASVGSDPSIIQLSVSRRDPALAEIVANSATAAMRAGAAGAPSFVVAGELRGQIPDLPS